LKQFRIGHVTATVVEEMLDGTFGMREFFPQSTQEVVEENLGWMAPLHYDPATGRMTYSVHCWLLDTGRHKVLIDTCVGNDKNLPSRPDWCNLQIPFLDRLGAAGAAPADIDYVLCTHLHADHVGWNTRLVDGRWVPTFPNAKYVFARRELEHWQANFNSNAAPHRAVVYKDSVLPIVESGQALVVDDYAEIADCIVIEPAPGHTPGHVAIWVTSGDSQAVLTGDILHHAIQVIHPHWCCFSDADMIQSTRTRKRILQACCENRALLLPGHFMSPHGGIVEDHGGELRMDFQKR
jgi:glyoxylase-like metal-dependent hydrolase (beta-lactamase superfamily II)